MGNRPITARLSPRLRISASSCASIKIDDARSRGSRSQRPCAWSLNGAEPVSVQTLRRFIERFAATVFAAEAMAPVYGLAESSVGLAFPPLGRAPHH